MKFRPRQIVGFAFISADGMIAEGDGSFPKAIENKADQAFFHESLNRFDVCVQGAHSHEGAAAANADNRARIVLTRRVASIAANIDFPRAISWNPEGASFEEAWRALGTDHGTLAVLGGTDVFGMFLEIGYDAFNLTRANTAFVPNGRPVFPGIPPQTPENILTSHGFKPGPPRVLDAAADVSVVSWTR